MLLLITHECVRAENGCPAGLIPYRVTDITSCGPVPAGYYGQSADGSSQLTETPPVVWKKTWGPIAFSKNNGAIGAATGLNSKKVAAQTALEDCRGAGGGECKLALAYENQCAAVAWEISHRSTNTAETLEIASDLALEGCSAISNQCKIVYGSCSRPIQTQ